MIFDIDKIASRFTTHISAPPERFQKAREAILEKFRKAGLEIPSSRERDKIIEFTAIAAMYQYECKMVEHKQEVPNPISPPRKGLWFFGGCGTGKTFTAKVISAAARIDFYDIRDIDRDYAERGYAIFRGDSPLCKNICVIDDIGSEAGSRFFGNPPVIEYLLEHRYQLWIDRRIPTVFTTNITNSDDIAEVYDHRIRSRVYEMCDRVFFGTIDQRISPETKNETLNPIFIQRKFYDHRQNQ